MNTSPLHKLQSDFISAITMRGSHKTAAAAAYITENDLLSADFRLSIYQNAYFARLIECLANDFQATQKILGEEIFTELARDYINAHPPQTPNINEVGQYFSSYIARHPFGREVEYLAETAELEWLVHATHYSAVGSSGLRAFDFSKLADISEDIWPQARFELNASLRAFHSQWPVDKLWQALAHENFAEVEAQLRPSPTSIVIWRSPQGVCVESLNKSQTLALSLMAQNKTLCEVADSLASVETDLSELMAWFANWVASQIVIRVHI